MAFDTTFTIKVDRDLVAKFRKGARDLYRKNPPDLVRELMEAAAEGRVTIHLTEEQKRAMSLYAPIESPEEAHTDEY